MSLKPKVDAIVAPYVDNPLECDGVTRVVSYLLDRHKIAHRAFVGEIRVSGGRKFSPHFWIVLEDTGEIVDYRTRMWFGGDDSIPQGVFPPGNGVEYDGHVTPLKTTKLVFEILTGERI